MRDFKEHLISENATLKDALLLLNNLALDAILFVIDDFGKLLGSLTDGDVRRGLLKGKLVNDKVIDYIQPSPKIISKSNYSVHDIVNLRKQNFKILPVLDEKGVVINIINFRLQKSYLPIDALVMAGGRGSRLSPMTDETPKPLLPIGDKAIIDHNVDRLRTYGIDDFHISLGYLGQQVEKHFDKKLMNGATINFVWEKKPLGTLGAASLVEKFQHDYILITNSDILTTLDYEDFFLDFLKNDADMSVVTVPYKVDIPYGVLETKDNLIFSLKEKPKYTYYSNGGIYIVKKELIKEIPKDTFYNATDLIEKIIRKGKIISYPIHQYWLDIGKPEDFEKARHDIKHLNI